MFPSNSNTTANYLNGGSTSVQSTAPVQQGADPTELSFGTTPAATPDGGGGGATYYDAAAAAAAANKAKANAMKGGINSLINSIKGVYDAIYGDIGVVGAEKAGQVNTKFNKENTALVDQFNTDFPQIGNAYASRGTYDSSYRQDSEAGAQKQFNNMADDLATGRDENQAAVGQWIAQQRAGVNADKGTLDSMSALIAQSEDPDELTALQQQLNQRIAEVQASRSGMRSQDAYRAEAAGVANTTDQSAGLRQTLSNIIAGAAPDALKRSVAGKLIQTSGLSAEQQSTLANDFEKQLSGESTTTEKVVA